jgi:probable HAF family extracellular repeat protein
MSTLHTNHLFRNCRRFLILIAICAIAPSVHAARFVGLGFLPGPGPAVYSSARGVSASGSTALGSAFEGAGLGAANWQGFRWTNGAGLVGVGNLAAGFAGAGTSAYGTSTDGSVIVGESAGSAFRWTAGGGIAMLGAGLARDVSSDGSVVVGNAGTAFRWTAGSGMVSLGDLAGGAVSSNAYSVSSDGSVVAGNSSSASGTEAFRWTAGGGMVGLGDLPGGSFYSDARRIAPDGSIVGFSNSAAGAEAFRWTSGGGMVGLGAINLSGFVPAGGPTVLRAISAAGTVVVGDGFSFPMGPIGQQAFIWDPTNGTRLLYNVLAPSVGSTLSGWTLTNAYAVSADGRTVVGEGISPSGAPQAWLAYLADQIYWFSETSGTWDAATNWAGPYLPTAADDIVIDPVAALTVTGPNSNRSVRSLTLGGTGTGRATLALSSITGELQATSSATINPDGELLLADGRILTTPALTNSGVVRGTGTVNANLTNLGGGEVRVASGQSLLVNGTSHSNSGKLEAIGGSLEFIGSLTNASSTGLVTGRSATLRFQSGLTNNGSLLLSAGVNDVAGDISNTATGKIIVAGGASATFYDDVVQNGTLQVIKLGSTTSVAVFAGAFTGSGGSSGDGDIFLLGDLRPGNSPAAVTFANNVALGTDSITHIELGGSAPGTQYDQIHVTGELSLGGTLEVVLINGFIPHSGEAFDLFDWGSRSGTFDVINLPTLSGFTWNTSQLYTSGEFSVGLAGDYNNNGVVDGSDYVVWRNGLGTKYTQNDYNVWRSHFGQTADSGAGAIANAAVPEPTTLLLMIAAVGGVTTRRRRCISRVSKLNNA